MNCNSFDFTRHAVEQMFTRKISYEEVKEAVKNGEIIKSYPEDQPYPSYLILAFINERPLHVVVAFETKSKKCIIVTVYVPSPDLWKDNFKTRKSN